MKRYKKRVLFFVTLLIIACTKEEVFNESNDAKNGFKNIVWSKKGLSVSSNLNKILFISDKVGFIIGDKGKLLKTVNGGNNWSEIKTGVSHDLKSISYDKISSVMINGLISSDKGKTWKILNSTKNYYSYYVSSNVLIGGSTSSFNGAVYRSVDNGKTWKSIYSVSPKTGYYNNGMFFGRIGYLSSWYSGRILKTIDGGVNWSIVADSSDKPEGGSEGYDDFTSISVKNKEVVYATSSKYILKSSNQGQKFSVLKKGAKNILFRALMVSEKNIITISTKGKVFISTDDGKTWKKFDVSSKKLNDVVIVGVKIFVIGDNGELWSN